MHLPAQGVELNRLHQSSCNMEEVIITGGNLEAGAFFFSEQQEWRALAVH